MNEQSNKALHLNPSSDTAYSSQLCYELHERATTIDYCAGSLIEEILQFPQEARDQMFPLLSVLRRACKEQLAMLNELKRNSPQQQSRRLEEVVTTY